MYDLSILIPSRNEMFLSKTIQDMLENSSDRTEIIVVLDGAWADPGVPDHKRVTLVYLPESVGQRAATNIACRLSKAKYVMKADAHTAWDKDFDLKMIEAFKETGDDVTMVPVMRNLHAFNWVCPDGHTRYQGPSGPCSECKKETTRDVVWIAKTSPQSTAYRFDKSMHFQYFGEWKKKQVGDLVETPSLQGSAFMLTREKYWELNMSDEELGSWGQQGVEVAMKTWLSGGRVIVNKRTWYAHMFRTQGGDFSFPYPQRPQSEIVATREKTRDLFVNGKWPQAKYDFNWYLDKFKPLPGWHDDTIDKNIGDQEIPDDSKKGIIFFTDNRLNLKIAHAVQKQLKRIGLPIVSSSLKPMDFGKNVVTDAKRGYHTYFKQIVSALEASTAEIIFFCEHDVLYPKEHFEFTPPDDKFYYNQNWVKAEWKEKKFTGRVAAWDADQVSGLVCYRETALKHYKKILENFDESKFNRSFEPESRVSSQSWRSKEPYVDIRQENALTKSKWSLDDFRDKSTAKNFRETTMPEWAKELI
jgi:glycosyltransferase involved in cell wall biosynthesis